MLEKPEIRARLDALLPLAEGFDRSWSFSAAGVEARALFFLPPTRPALTGLLAAAEGLDMSEATIAGFRAALPGADALGLTLSQGRSVRLYLQYWERMVQRVLAGDLAPAPLYLGFKQFPDGTARTDVYHCLPMAPEAEYRPVLEAALTGFGCAPEAVARLLEPLTPDRCIWTRTEGVGRASWLATLRRSEIPAGDLAAALAPVADRAGVPELLAALEDGAPLHIAGGEDGRKGAFLTFYVETGARAMTHFLDRLG